ncbi:MAG: hypothetical protein NW208_07335 [Bryobacter sp.]|nr:hypothetical protein [Bryobacter sp.]
MHQLTFPVAHKYSDLADSVTVPVTLRVGALQLSLAASIDTGASFCLFGWEVAVDLGLNPEDGIPMSFRTATGRFSALGYDVEIEVLGLATTSVVFFFEDVALDKNVLGRTGWLDRVQLGLVHHDNQLFLAPPRFLEAVSLEAIARAGNHTSKRPRRKPGPLIFS